MNRTVKLSDGSEFEVRPLKRGELRKLRAQGLDLMGAGGGGAAALDAMDAVLDMVFPDKQPELDEMTLMDTAAIFRGIVAATFSTEEEVKNS